MSTVIRPEVSKKNKYWISKHRYYELKHFCLQYNEWQDQLSSVRVDQQQSFSEAKTYGHGDPTVKRFMTKAWVNTNMVKDAAKEATDDMWMYIVLAVTSGLSYDKLAAYVEIPCCRDTFYEYYRKFFYFLDKKRD